MHLLSQVDDGLKQIRFPFGFALNYFDPQSMDVVDENESLEAGSEFFPPASSPLDFIEGDLRPPKPSLLYRLGLTVVAFAMILLPLIYFSIVGFFGYCVYYYATRYHTILGWKGFGAWGQIIKLMMYFGPLFFGAALTFFLVKPIFNRRSDDTRHYSLNFADAPQLFALIGWICRSLNAPIPSRIDVDCDVNASAGFRGGWRSLFGNDIVLTIGLPLVSGMNQSQFAGVIAHEYGHFSQGTAMRASYIIRNINIWFFRVVYERDEWDASLEEASEDSDQDLRFTLLLYLTRLGIWVGRSIPWVLMVIGHLLSSFMSRQMEFDADGYGLKMSGTQTFIATTQRLKQLGLGTAIAQKQLLTKWKKERKLFDQLPEFIVSRANEIPAQAQEQLFSSVLQQKTRLFDSHPSDAQRIQRALQANEPGIFHQTGPATSLFANFPELSRKITISYYEALTGAPFTSELLDSTEQVTRDGEYDYSPDQQRIKNYFSGVTTSLRPLLIPESKALVFRSSEDLIADIKGARQQMEGLLPTAQDAYNALKLADEKVLLARQSAFLVQAGYPYNPADFGTETLDTGEALAAAQSDFDAAVTLLQPFEAAAKTRLLAALQLLRLPLVATSIPDAVKLQDHAKQMSWVLSRLAPAFDPLLELRRECASLEVLLQYRQSHGANTLSEIDNLLTRIQELLNKIQESVGTIRYPFQHASQNLFVSDYARNKEYDSDPYQRLLREGNSHVEKLIALYYRLLGNLITVAETVESHVVNNHV